MFGSSLPPVFRRRADVLFSLFMLAYLTGPLEIKHKTHLSVNKNPKLENTKGAIKNG
jgi:hypothetical protein